MFQRGSLKLPITLGVLMIVSVIALTVGWILLSAFSAASDGRWAPLYLTLLTVGTAFLLFVLVGVVMYLVLSIRAINLNRRQSNFIDSVTHELKSPITSLKLYLQTLGRRRVSPEEQSDFVRFMLDDVERLDALINHLLDAARLDDRIVAEELEHVDLRQVLTQCIEAVCLRHQVSPDVVEVNVEPLLIHGRAVDVDLIFRNLLDNAVKYAGNDPHIQVQAKYTGDQHCLVRISDNGAGIPYNLRGKIFGRFFRRGEELERDTPGLGLGLHIVRTLVKRLPGKIRVRDRSGGPGTTFEVTLPVVERTDPAGSTSHTVPTAKKSGAA